MPLPLAPAILYCSLLCQRGRNTMAWHVRDQQSGLVVIRQDVVVKNPRLRQLSTRTGLLLASVLN